MLTKDLPRIFDFIGGTVRGAGGVPLRVGGIENHIHILASMPKNKTLPDFMREVKAVSSRWIKSLDPCYARFAWQDGYGAFSVSASGVQAVINYINNQRQHHRNISFKDEFLKFLNAYGVEYDEKYLL